jgi:hypothetical protein
MRISPCVLDQLQRHRIAGCGHLFRGNTLAQETRPVESVTLEKSARAAVAVPHLAQMPMQDDRHFFPPRFVIGSMPKSPYQITFAPVTVTVPKTTGIGRPCSAVGTSKSEMDAGLGAGGFGASA